MKDRVALSRGEMEVASVLWRLGEGTVRQVFDTFPMGREIDFSTVQTYLRRLEAKGYAKTRLEGRVRVYTPTVKPGTVKSETVNDLVDRLFGGETMSLVRHLVEDKSFSAEELKELRRLVRKLKEDDHA
jgi:BlaI family transcriptional regulator, penicillinase repressor